jgi:hypothetical protein
MTRYPVCLALTLLFTLCSAAQSLKLEIGAALPANYRETREELMTAMAQTWPVVQIKDRGIQYTVGFESETGLIRYVLTTDERFRTKSGLRIGSTITVTPSSIDTSSGMEVRAEAIEGWQPIVDRYDKVLGAQTDSNESKVLTRLVTHKEVRAKIIGFVKGR